MLWPVATSLHSSSTFSSPLSVNLVKPRLRLMLPNAVSTSTERLSLRADPASLRSISLARPLNAFGVGFTRIRLGRSASSDLEHLALICFNISDRQPVGSRLPTAPPLGDPRPPRGPSPCGT